MDLLSLATAVQAAAVTAGLLFAVVQIRDFRREQRRRLALTLMHSLQTPEMLKGMLVVDDLPENLSAQEIDNALGEDLIACQTLLGTWESLGILVCRGELGLDLVDDFYSGPIIQSWKKLAPWVDAVRKRTERATRWEYFQWLAERLIEQEREAPPVPAYVEYRDWRKGTET